MKTLNVTSPDNGGIKSVPPLMTLTVLRRRSPIDSSGTSSPARSSARTALARCSAPVAWDRSIVRRQRHSARARARTGRGTDTRRHHWCTAFTRTRESTPTSIYVPSGHLIYAAAGTLRAVAFDLECLEANGTPTPVLPQLMTLSSGVAEFDVASNGTLVYVTGGADVAPLRTLVWVDRQGREAAIRAAPARAYNYPRLSPDGRRVALDIRDQDQDIWWRGTRRATCCRMG
jgi:hypothetical protein